MNLVVETSYRMEAWKFIMCLVIVDYRQYFVLSFNGKVGRKANFSSNK